MLLAIEYWDQYIEMRQQRLKLDVCRQLKRQIGRLAPLRELLIERHGFNVNAIAGGGELRCAAILERHLGKYSLAALDPEITARFSVAGLRERLPNAFWS